MTNFVSVETMSAPSLQAICPALYTQDPQPSWARTGRGARAGGEDISGLAASLASERHRSLGVWNMEPIRLIHGTQELRGTVYYELLPGPHTGHHWGEGS